MNSSSNSNENSVDFEDENSFFQFQEDLTPKDMEEIIDDIIAGRTPRPGPRYDHM